MEFDVIFRELRLRPMSEKLTGANFRKNENVKKKKIKLFLKFKSSRRGIFHVKDDNVS